MFLNTYLHVIKTSKFRDMVTTIDLVDLGLGLGLYDCGHAVYSGGLSFLEEMRESNIGVSNSDTG